MREGEKKKGAADFKPQPVYTLLMNIILKTNIYVKQCPLAVNLILKRGLVFQTWLPLRSRDDFHLASPLHPTGVTPVGIASTAVTLLHHARRLLTRTAWNLSYFPVSIFTG